MPLALRISVFDGVNKNAHELLIFEHAPRGLYLKMKVTMCSLSRCMHLTLIPVGHETSSPNLILGHNAKI